MKRLICLLLAAAMLFSLCACGKSERKPEDTAEAKTHVIVDNLDNEVEVPYDINRIVICNLWPMASVLSVFFDSAEKIVGIPPECMASAENGLLGQLYPEILNAETGYSKANEVNMEELAALMPDIVFYNANTPDLGQQFAELGIPAVAISATKCGFDAIKTLNSWIALLSEIFPANDKAEAVSDYSEKIYNMVQERVADIPDGERAQALFVYQCSETDLLVSGKNFFGQYWADSIGAVNVGKELEEGTSVAVNMEQVYSWNPDLIFITNFTPATPDDLYNNTIGNYDWSNIAAVEDGNVHKMPLGMYRSFTPGIDTPVTLLWLAKTAYPELFEDIDVTAEAMNYYKDVFGVELTNEQAQSIFAPSSAAGKI